MNIILYKPLYYDLNKSADDINFIPDENIIKDAINSFFLGKTPSYFRWLETLRRDHYRREAFDNYNTVYWSLSNPRKEVFKKLEVVSVY